MFKTLTVKLVDFWLRLSCAQDRSLNLPKTLHLICAKTCCSVTKSYLTLCDTMNYSTPGSPGLHNLQSFLKFMFIESVMLSNHLLLCCPLLLLPSVFPSIRVFSNELAVRIRWPKYQSFSFSISASSKYSVLISFSIDWFDLLVVQGTLKSLLQHRNLKASTLWCSASSWSNSHTCT